MAKKGFIAIGMPAPDALKKGSGKGMSEEYGEGGSDEGDAEGKEADHAAGVSAMGDFLRAIGVKGQDPAKAFQAYLDLMEHC